MKFIGAHLALILVLLTVATGLVVLINRLVWKIPPRGSETQLDTGGTLSSIVENCRAFFPVLLFVLVVRSFIFEPFRIPSGSMMPTLLQGDFIFVQKWAYGLRLPVTETKFIETGSPERGDVVVFRLPQEPSINYIKRVIGVPGDVIVYKDHRLNINGEPVPLVRADDYSRRNPRYLEELGGDSHSILITSEDYAVNEGRFVVPEGQYFVMGDNRDNSRDSRFIGSIPETHLVGEAVRIWMHIDGWSWPRWERIGTKIQ